ncbi:MAG TPA: GNAT family N-acetyltransferase [Acidimicrobiales bacterium]|nr:GNAT family N-acetyltransferase [Acidimicrobiales bacterium]
MTTSHDPAEQHGDGRPPAADVSPETDVDADVVLSDGSTVHIRPIRPDDGDRLVRFHSRLSPDTQYLRFFSPHPVLLPREIDRFTHVDYWNRFAIVAVRNDEFVGVARYDRQPDSDEGEVAFVIEDAQQGKGLGMLLLEHLAAAARRRNITRFVAETLPMNSRMLQVFRQAGFTATTKFDDGVVHVEFPISPTEESQARQERREHRAEARSVARLLSPRSIAVIGASREPGTVGWAVFRSLLEGGFQGAVYPVNPSAAFVASVRSYPSVLDIPDPVDLAVLAVPAATVVDVVRDCGRKGVNGLVILSAGFGEANVAGDLRQRDVVAAARGGGMRLVGPNCIGIINTDPDVSLNATFATEPPQPGPIGILSQSGALGVALLHLAGQVDLGVSSFVSVGNKADVSGNDLIQYWEDDPRTSVILLYLESFGNPRKFSRIARRVGRAKPIVAVKSGRTAAALRAVAPRWVPDVGTDVAVEALFRQTGVIRVETVRDMVDVAQILAHQPLPRGRRVAIVSNSGGPGVMAADVSASAGLEVPELGESTQAHLRALLHPDSVVRNPVDLVAAAGRAEYEETLRAVLDDDAVDAAIAIFTPTARATADEVAEAIAGAVARRPGKPVLSCFLATPVIPRALRPPEPHGPGACIPFYPAPEGAVLALARVARYAEWRTSPEGAVPDLEEVDAAAARAVVAAALVGSPGGRPLTAEEADAVLAAYGIAVTRESATGPTPREGVETLVGIVQNPSFGPLVMFGMGGLTAELLGDRAYRAVPLTDVDASHLVRSLGTSPLLFGYRDAPAADVPALEELLLRVGRIADDLPEVADLELGPVIVGPHGLDVAGARIRVTPPPPEGPDTRRLRDLDT